PSRRLRRHHQRASVAPSRLIRLHRPVPHRTNQPTDRQPAMSTNLVNGAPQRITYHNNETDLVTRKRLSIQELYQWAKHFANDDTPALVALCCGKPANWSSSLSDESFAELAEICCTENFTRAMTIARRDPIMAGTLAPALARMGDAERSATASAPSPGPTSNSSSPAPARSGSAEASGSASSSSPPAASSPSSPSETVPAPNGAAT